MADVIAKSLVNNFFELLGEWNYNFPLTTQWAVAIQPDAGNNLFSIIRKYTELDVYNFYIPESIQQSLLNEKSNPKTDELGLYFAQQVTIPKESFSPKSEGVDNMGGYIKGIVGGDRLGLDAKLLGIDFLETNIDFGSGLIRPWIIAASYKGMINLGSSNSIKCEITIREFTGSSKNNIKPLRKYHKFKGCVPIDINEKVLKYDTESLRIDTVNWIFDEYTYEIKTS
jgi:hypothetical protein